MVFYIKGGMKTESLGGHFGPRGIRMESGEGSTIRNFILYG